jgi:hypothetical protein
MKALFNCSVIKNVYLRDDTLHIELEITYTDDPDRTWISRKSVESVSSRVDYKEKYKNAYNTIKQALLNNEKFVEVEL